MFDATSRYYSIETLTLATEGGDVRYLRRRFLPLGETLIPMARVRVTGADRLDLIAFQTLGDPLRFWRIADANNAMNPFELTAELERELAIPVPDLSGK